MKTKLYVVPFWLLWMALLLNDSLFAQTSEVKRYLEMVEKGQADSVRPYLSDIVSKYQNDPGVIYLQARITQNGIEAVKLYQSIVTNFPKSEWADDAMYRIYQYYYAMGLYKTSEQKFNNLKKNYPNSPYVTGTAEVKFPEVDEPKPRLTEEISDTHTVVSVQDEKIVDEAVHIEKAIPKVEKQTTSSSGKYTLQVGAFSTSANAEKQKSLLTAYGQPIEIKSSVRNGRTLYLVLVGSFLSQDEAKIVGKDLKAKYQLQSMVVER
jgi:tetratricopeptide (TPR) repeat protein